VLIHSTNPIPTGLALHLSEDMLSEVPEPKLTRRTVGGYLQQVLPSRKYKRSDSAIVTVSSDDISVIGLGNLVSKKTAKRLKDMGANVLDIEEDS
jgi:hypothetical protein